MAISTYKVYLMRKAKGESSYTKLVDIKDFPDVGSNINLLETTTMSDAIQTYIRGIKQVDSGGLQFTANYTKTDYAALHTIETTGDEDDTYGLWFGGTESSGVVTPDGSDGKFEWNGTLSVGISGAGVDEVVDMIVTCAPSTEIKWVE